MSGQIATSRYDAQLCCLMQISFLFSLVGQLYRSNKYLAMTVRHVPDMSKGHKF